MAAPSVSLAQALLLSTILYLSLPHGYPNKTYMQRISKSEVTTLLTSNIQLSLLLLTSGNSITIHALLNPEIGIYPGLLVILSYLSQHSYEFYPLPIICICTLCSLSSSSKCSGLIISYMDDCLLGSSLSSILANLITSIHYLKFSRLYL